MRQRYCCSDKATLLRRNTHEDAPHVPPTPTDPASAVLIRDQEITGVDQDGDLVGCSWGDLSVGGKCKVQNWLKEVKELDEQVGDELPRSEVAEHLVVPWTEE